VNIVFAVGEETRLIFSSGTLGDFAFPGQCIGIANTSTFHALFNMITYAPRSCTLFLLICNVILVILAKGKAFQGATLSIAQPILGNR